MVIETLYVGRNNTFSLQLVRGGEAVNLLMLSSYALYLSNGRVFNSPNHFIEKPDGVLEVVIGSELTLDDVGSHKSYLVSFDPVNVDGVRWPDFKIKVRA